MSKNKSELQEEIIMLKALLKNQDSLSSEYKSYSDNFNIKLEKHEKYMHKLIEEKISGCEKKLRYREVDYISFLIFLALSAALTYVYANYLFGK